MNGCSSWQRMDYGYGPMCPYRDTCPMRSECPYCPHQMEDDLRMTPGYYGNMNMGMEYYGIENVEHAMVPNPAAPLEYGYDNLYPNNMAMLSGMENKTGFPVSSEYNHYGFINPAENMLSPWENNKMCGNNIIPIENCPYR